MSEQDEWWMRNEKTSLRLWITTHMLRGAAAAGAVVFAVIFFMLVLRAFSELLPEDPFASLDTDQAVQTALV